MADIKPDDKENLDVWPDTLDNCSLSDDGEALVLLANSGSQGGSSAQEDSVKTEAWNLVARMRHSQGWHWRLNHKVKSKKERKMESTELDWAAERNRQDLNNYL